LLKANFSDEAKQQLKPFNFTVNNFHPYSMKRDGWYLTNLRHAFSIDEQTLRDMDYVFSKFNFPVYLTSRETNGLKRELCGGVSFKETSQDI